MAGPAISRMALTIALLFVYSSESSHAQECTLQSDQYIGVLTNDGRCFPWRKRQENLIAGLPRCKPDLKGRVESPLLPEIVNGEFSSTKECVPIEFDPPFLARLRSMTMQRSIDELKDEVKQMKSKLQ